MATEIFAWTIVGLALLVTILVIVMMCTMLVQVFFFVPFVPTPPKVIKAMLDLAAIKPNENVYELGAGNGRMVAAVKKRCPQANVIGYEIAPIVWLFGKFNLWWRGTDAPFRRRNFMKDNLSDADVILLYLSPRFMRMLEEKFSWELKPGTRIVSHAFPFPGKNPAKHDGKVYLYRW